jgi:hypothetical protein
MAIAAAVEYHSTPFSSIADLSVTPSRSVFDPPSHTYPLRREMISNLA